MRRIPYIKGRIDNGILFLNQIPRVGKLIRLQFDRGNYTIVTVLKNRLTGLNEWSVFWGLNWENERIDVIFKVDKKKCRDYNKQKGWKKSNLRKRHN